MSGARGYFGITSVVRDAASRGVVPAAPPLAFEEHRMPGRQLTQTPHEQRHLIGQLPSVSVLSATRRIRSVVRWAGVNPA